MTSALKVSGGRRRSHSRRRGLLGDMKYVLSGSRRHNSRRRMRGGVKGGAAPAAAAEPVVGGAVDAAAPVPEVAGGAVVAESKAPEVAPVSGGRRRRSRSRRRRYSLMRGGLFDDFQAPMMGGSRVFDAGFDGVLGGDIDGGRRRYRRHRSRR